MIVLAAATAVAAVRSNFRIDQDALAHCTGADGFLMAISKLKTAARLSLPLVVVVYNDSAYGAQVHNFTTGDDQEDLEIVRFPVANTGSHRRVYGAAGIIVNTREDLAAGAELLAGSGNRPLVVDARIASDGGAWWLAEVFRIIDRQRVTTFLPTSLGHTPATSHHYFITRCKPPHQSASKLRYR